MPLSPTAKLVAGAFTVSGAVHLVRPKTFEPAIPTWVPAHREVIIGSGVAELACAAGLLLPRTQKAAAYASTALLVAVYPAYAQMAVDALKAENAPAKAAMLARPPPMADDPRHVADGPRRLTRRIGSSDDEHFGANRYGRK